MSAETLVPPADGDDAGVALTLAVGDIHPYERNPRTTPNPRYAEIKASIRQRGFIGHLTVTSRPGEAGRYLLYMGGGTRLQILKELHAETADARFGRVRCFHRAWAGEADLLASFLVENEARGDTLFLEKARGLVDLARAIEAETGRALSARDIQLAATKLGMAVSQPTVLLYQFAVARLQPLGPWLTRDNVSVLKRRYAQYEAFAFGLRQAGRFSAQVPERMADFLTGFARRMDERRAPASEEGERAALRGETLAGLVHGLDHVIAETLELDPESARSLSSTLDAAAQASANRSAETSRVEKSGGAVARSETQKTSSPATLPQSRETLSRQDFNAIGQRFFACLQAWCDETRIGQWLENGTGLDLPFLFWLELPEEIACAGEPGPRFEDIADPKFGRLSPEAAGRRASSYRLIAWLSGQLGGATAGQGADVLGEAAFAERLPPESPWRAALVAAPSIEDFRKTWSNRLGGLVCRKTGRLGLAAGDLLSLLQAPPLAQRWIELTAAHADWGQALARWRAPGAGTDQGGNES